MKPSAIYTSAWLDADTPNRQDSRLWLAYAVESVTIDSTGAALLAVTLHGCAPGEAYNNGSRDRRSTTYVIRAYGTDVVRFSSAAADPIRDNESPMLQRDPTLTQAPLTLTTTDEAWELHDAGGRLRSRVPRKDPPQNVWSDLIKAPVEKRFRLELFPDGTCCVPFQSHDTFAPRQINSVPLGLLEHGNGDRAGVAALYAFPGERFAGTGERFSRLDLAGGTYVLENADALGVNNRRAYKNVPFYLSSRGYGLFLHTSAHVRISLADVSTRAVLLRVDEPDLDLFLIGGGHPERVLHHYRRLTGFPPMLPRWSYGVWMSRMTYFTAAECEAIAARLRAEDYPCDVIHLDTGWFRQDWKCEWEFSEERFPDPAGFMARLRAQGFRTTLWQTPWVAAGTKHHAEAEACRYIVPSRAEAISGSDFSDSAATPDNRAIDFSNPAAVAWYQGLLERLLRLGASAIKTDFGEFMDPAGEYHGLPYALLHNRYPILYQRAAWEATARVTGEPLIWARSGWAGCQRYPVHWGGDCAATWDGLAASLRGGLHLGLSGYAHWSHDVPGFHGVPDFMNNRPSETLYLRWTQAAVFGSHIRYHGTSAREPWEYPGVAGLVRAWWRLRYALVPYLEEAAAEATRSGYPVMRALLLHDPSDPTCWHVDDQFLCGHDLLVSVVLSDDGVRRVYLPAGEWVDLWTGEVLAGGRWLPAAAVPPGRLPLHGRRGAHIPYYPLRVRCTADMDPRKRAILVLDETYRGLASSPLGALTGLT